MEKIRETNPNEENSSFWALCRHPVFYCQLLLAGLLFVSLLIGAFKDWPSYPEDYSWAFFLNIGTAASLFFMEVASILSWLFFENANWVYYVLTYITHGVILIVCSAFFFFYSVLQYEDEGEDLWPCLNRNNITELCTVSIYQKTTASLLIFTAGAYVFLAFYIMMTFRRNYDQPQPQIFGWIPWRQSPPNFFLNLHFATNLLSSVCRSVTLGRGNKYFSRFHICCIQSLILYELGMIISLGKFIAIKFICGDLKCRECKSGPQLSFDVNKVSRRSWFGKLPEGGSQNFIMRTKNLGESPSPPKRYPIC